MLDRMRWLAAFAALALAGCLTEGPNTVTMSIMGAPSLVMYRDGAGAWHDAGAGTSGDYALHVTDAYMLVVVCSDATGFDTVVRARTFDDGDRDYLYCAGHGLAPSSVQVTGRMLQPGTVSAGDFASSTTAPWDFALQIEPGTRDVMAVGNGRVAIGRDLAISKPTQLTLIDTDKNGTPLVPVALALANLRGDETITTEVDLYGANNVAFGPQVTGAIAQTIPASLLVASDQVDLLVDVATATTDRTADTWFTGAETQLAIMPEISGVTFATAGGSLQASWGVLPSYTALGIAVDQTTPTTTARQEFSASQSYLDRTVTTQLDLAFDPPPRFDRAWLIDLTQPHVRSFTASDGSTGIVYTSSVRESVGGATPRTAPHGLR
jgi:hypothetical protein